MIPSRLTTASAALVLAPLVASAAVYSRLPAVVPIHFDWHGRIDGWAPRALGALLLPAIGVAMLAIGRLFVRKRPPAEAEATEGVLLLVAALFAALHGIILTVALVPSVDPAKPLVAALCSFWGALSLLLPRLRRNPFAGIRTPWTLADDEVWARTHRFAGQIGFVAALLAGVSAAMGMPAVAISTVIVSAVLPVGFSYWIAKGPRASA